MPHHTVIHTELFDRSGDGIVLCRVVRRPLAEEFVPVYRDNATMPDQSNRVAR